jgi:hypothetical protein
LEPATAAPRVRSVAAVRSLRIAWVVATAVAGGCQAESHASEAVGSEPAHEKVIKTYFGGWKKKDWGIVASQLAERFTFTSPAPDDHHLHRAVQGQVPDFSNLAFARALRYRSPEGEQRLQ